MTGSNAARSSPVAGCFVAYCVSFRHLFESDCVKFGVLSRKFGIFFRADEGFKSPISVKSL